MMNILEIANAIGVEGFLHCNEAQKLAELAINRDVLEIGAYKGLSAWCMAITAKSVTCVDTFRARTNGQDQMEYLTTYDAFREATRRFANVEAHVMTSEAAGSSLQREFDMILVDALHLYEDVLADFNRWWPRVRPGGIMAMHDYGHGDFPGVKKAADEVFGPAKKANVCVTLRWVEKPA